MTVHNRLVKTWALALWEARREKDWEAVENIANDMLREVREEPQ